MKSLHSSNKTPKWQVERANRLHRMFGTWHAQNLSGKYLRRVIHRTSRRLNGKPFKSDRRHHWALSTGRLYQLYRLWRLRGQVPSAIQLNYRVRPPFVPAGLIVRFVNFCAGRRFRTMKQAWENFAASVTSKRGKSSSKPLGVSYGQLIYHFPAQTFYQMRHHLDAREAANQNLNILRLQAIADIRNRLPDKPPRRRGDDFQI